MLSTAQQNITDHHTRINCSETHHVGPRVVALALHRSKTKTVDLCRANLMLLLSVWFKIVEILRPPKSHSRVLHLVVIVDGSIVKRESQRI